MPPVTDFRKAVAAYVADVTGIGLVVHGERDGVASDGGDLIAVWTTASTANDENALFRLYACTARVLYAWDPQVTPDEDDPLDELEQLEYDVVNGIPAILGGARVVSVDAGFDPSGAAIDLIIMGEVRNGIAEA